jgi:hypothetical protein
LNKRDYRCTKCGNKLGEGQITGGYIEILCAYKGKRIIGKCDTLNRIPFTSDDGGGNAPKNIRLITDSKYKETPTRSEPMTRRLILASFAVLSIIYLSVFGVSAYDWYGANQLYTDQKQVMHRLINEGQPYADVKKTVSYLQGNVTRKMNNMRSMASSFIIVTLVHGAFIGLHYSLDRRRRIEEAAEEKLRRGVR